MSRDLYAIESGWVPQAKGKAMTHGRLVGRIALFATAVGWASCAGAQTTTRGPGARNDDGRHRTAYLAGCAARAAPASARKLMATLPGSDEEAGQAKDLLAFSPHCYRRRPDVDPTAFRNAVSQAIYEDKYSRDAPKIDDPARKPPASFGIVPADKKGDDRQQAIWGLAAVANCAVFVAPNAVRDLILGPVGGTEEADRYKKVAPAIGQCVSADADKLTADLFRGYLATALLTRTEAAAQ